MVEKMSIRRTNRGAERKGPWCAGMVLPLIRLEAPGWGILARPLHLFGAANDVHWAGAPRKTVRGKWHRYLMDLDLSDWSERQTYFLARYHELAAQLLMDRCLAPADRVVDVGANIGMLTLHAAARVTAAGIVDSFEPNPACCRRIRAALDRNAIGHVRLHEAGLSDSAGELTLKVLQNHTGMGTLADVPDAGAGAVTSSFQVPVETADAVLMPDPRPIAFVKVDVEGFETRVLRGMHRVLELHKPVVAAEVIPEWLERAGSSVAELFGLMRGMEYEPYGMATSRRWMRHHLSLVPTDRDCVPVGIADIVWIPNHGPFGQRLAGLLGAPRAKNQAAI